MTDLMQELIKEYQFIEEHEVSARKSKNVAEAVARIRSHIPGQYIQLEMEDPGGIKAERDKNGVPSIFKTLLCEGLECLFEEMPDVVLLYGLVGKDSVHSFDLDTGEIVEHESVKANLECTIRDGNKEICHVAGFRISRPESEILALLRSLNIAFPYAAKQVGKI